MYAWRCTSSPVGSRRLSVTGGRRRTRLGPPWSASIVDSPRSLSDRQSRRRPLQCLPRQRPRPSVSSSPPPTPPSVPGWDPAVVVHSRCRLLECRPCRPSPKSSPTPPPPPPPSSPPPCLQRPMRLDIVLGSPIPSLGPPERRWSLPQTTVQGGVTNGGSADLDPNPEPAADPDNALVYRDGNLVSGSLDALIQHMVPTTDYYPDRAYLFAFLLSSRLFIKPHELLGRVIALCDSQQKLSDKPCPSKDRLSRFIPRLVQLMAEWSETFPYDFRDERVMAHVRSITQSCVSVAGAAGEARVRHEVSTLLQNLLHRLTALEKYEEFLQRVNAESTTSNAEALNMTDVIDVCPAAALLAQHLTHIELERLSFIGPEEFVQAFAKDNPHVETSFKDMKKTRNLESYVSWFNRLSYFVATEVVKHAKKKQRVRVVEFWIETARECFNIGNFNSLMAIIAGLNMSPISRLKKTWNKVQSAKFSVLEHQMDPSSNFCNYRSTLKAAMWRSAGATDQSQRIVIPFFSLLVKDLYFLNEGCSNKLPNGHINFEKFWQLAKQVTEFITWKQVTCPFEKNPKVITFLQASPVLTENALALASFECEPPENSVEKERCKALKAEMTS
ncbi:ras-GEF domain-containing family member 1B-like isoform X2 [Macrosteles quadrilineatus]|uniref:ras-GEF domain-containing family member 1B-like isoform X2 n=1 Tax=Macrosteles quadrilineatus TaxID=74068 RepID=UPI0023E22FB1|nr:ras-GEF domain-containing family member 1B-like isoform X2 [Macrosteles quadrilineatus]